jgi:hypothetical protein
MLVFRLHNSCSGNECVTPGNNLPVWIAVKRRARVLLFIDNERRYAVAFGEREK